jgi:peptidoglycan-N-acetylglucosamine deacetylase
MARRVHYRFVMNSADRIKRHSKTTAIASAVVLATLAVTHAGCQKSTSAKGEKTCTGAQALSKTPLTGASMPLKTLALTFDDGPGARTIELSRYLKEQGIKAGFFVWGQALQNDGAGTFTLQKLIDDGHLVANHTEHHYSLTMHEPAPLTEAEVVAELTEVDAMLAPVIKNDVWLFRPPYGHWNDGTVAALDKTPMKKYVGPILWNIGGTMGANQAADTECWKPGTLKTVQECGDLYMKEIDNVGKGIVLLHDPYFIDMNNPESGGTYQMVQYIVPLLKAKGYTFIRVDEVPEIKALLPGGAGPDAGVPPAPGEEPTTTTDPTTPSDDTGNPCP